jgi:hypothetical protein
MSATIIALPPGVSEGHAIAGSETTSRLERLEARMRLLSRDLGEVSSTVDDVKAVAAQEHRWHAYVHGEKRSKDIKHDELLRTCRDLKSRLDKIESPGRGDYHAYSSFEAVSRKISELERATAEAQRVARNASLWARLFGETIVAVAVFTGSVAYLF